MRRHLVLAVALGAGCGNVTDKPTDGPPAHPDADLLGTLRQGCLVMEHMDEAAWTGAAGEVRDDCGGDNNGTVQGAGNTVANGVKGRSGGFSGNACIEIADTAALHGTTGLTLSAWVLPTALNGVDSNGIITKRVDFGVEASYSLYLWTGNHVWVDIDGENDRASGTAVVTNNNWVQITMVYDGSRPVDVRTRVFINNQLDVTLKETSATLPAFTAPLRIGCMPNPSGPTMQNFIGQMDEVAIWSRALTDAELGQWYAATKP